MGCGCDGYSARRHRAVGERCLATECSPGVHLAKSSYHATETKPGFERVLYADSLMLESNRAFTKKFLLKAGGECLPLLHTHTAWTHRNVRRTAPDPTSDWRGTRLRCSGGSTTDYPPRGAAAQRFNPVFSATPTSATLLRSAAFSVCSLPSCSCSRSSLSWSRRLRALAWF